MLADYLILHIFPDSFSYRASIVSCVRPHIVYVKVAQNKQLGLREQPERAWPWQASSRGDATPVYMQPIWT